MSRMECNSLRSQNTDNSLSFTLEYSAGRLGWAVIRSQTVALCTVSFLSVKCTGFFPVPRSANDGFAIGCCPSFQMK